MAESDNGITATRMMAGSPTETLLEPDNTKADWDSEGLGG
jgi:hypothetical protein